MSGNREIGSKIIALDVTDSTNEEMRRRVMANPGLESGLVIWAKEQTNGRGLGENTWESQPGENLTLSLLIRPDFLTAAEQFYLNIAVSLGIFELMKFYFVDKAVKIKWPNDIYVGEQKIGGVLINHTVSGSDLMSSIIGIGLNVNQTTFSETLPNPVSMKQLAGYSFDLEMVLNNLLVHLENYYVLIRKKQFAEFREAYKHALFGYYKWLKFKKSGRTIVARITGISEFGLLQLEKESGELEECDLKEIGFVI